MTPDERQLIDGLFDRMRGYDLPQKDREAEALINQAVRATPDAPYMLVQSVLVQEQALEAANARLQELEARVRELERARSPSRAAAASSADCSAGHAPTPSGVRAACRRSGRAPAACHPCCRVGRNLRQETAQPATGGFMRSAMTTAAGVAGGMLLAEGIRGMMGGGSAQAKPAESHDSGGDKKTEQAQVDDDPGPEQADYDSSHNDTVDWGGDLDI